MTEKDNSPIVHDDVDATSEANKPHQDRPSLAVEKAVDGAEQASATSLSVDETIAIDQTMTIDKTTTVDAPITEQSKPTEPPQAHQSTVNKTTTQNEKKPTMNTQPAEPASHPRQAPSKLAILSIALVIALAGGLYVQSQQQAELQKAATDNLQTQLNSLQQKLTQTEQIQQQIVQLNQQQQQLIQQINQQNAAQKNLAAQTLKAENELVVQERNILMLHEKMSALSTTDTSSWLIAQADYLVKLAGRKIWNDEDFVTARLLLKSADASIAQINDPSLIPLRSAINEDITALASISQVDFDGLILRLNQLSSQILTLSLADNVEESGQNTDYYDETIDAADDSSANVSDLTGPLTDSLSDWKQNLSKSWRSFMNQFVTITKRNDLTECLALANSDSAVQACSTLAPLLAPEQDVYLRENLRLQLFIAAQAVPRHQNAIYQQSLENVSTWVRAYFDPNNPLTKAFLAELDELAQQSFNMDLPETLKSSSMLDKIMQTRVRNLLSQPTSNALGG